MATRQPVDIAVYAGTFESQQLVFAHLYDLAAASGAAMALDEIEVICKTDPTRRLAHYFAPATVADISAELGLHTTVVLVFPEASVSVSGLDGSPRLTGLGTFAGTRVRA